jgi:uncharacterized glyoxalase superfamily protein PhnB
MATLDLVGLVVKDMAVSLRFYRLLGLAIPDKDSYEDHEEVTLPNGLRLAWDTLSLIQQVYPNWETELRGNRIGIAFKCATAAEVDAVYQQVIAAGYASHKAPWDAFWGQRYAVVQDPDGNLVDLFAPLEP